MRGMKGFILPILLAMMTMPLVAGQEKNAVEKKVGLFKAENGLSF